MNVTALIVFNKQWKICWQHFPISKPIEL